LSTTSQTPLRQPAIPSATEHTPLSRGVVALASGTGRPLGTFGSHNPSPMSQYWVDKQSEFFAQPCCGGPHTMLPSLATLQTPLRHTSVAAACVHVPFSIGVVWPGSVGILPLSMIRGVHTPIEMSHQLPKLQSASAAQLTVVTTVGPRKGVGALADVME
jgi:hypothetical protein